jgi:preprotein translocase subunit SecD
MKLLDYLSDKRIMLLLIILIALALLDLRYGVHLGIEFAGGTQIPVTLANPVNPAEMATVINILQQRVSTFGLKEAIVEGVGNSQVYVSVPSVSGSEINSTINLIESQGVFQGVVGQAEALNGSSILQGSIGAIPPNQFNGNVSWGVNFFINQKAAEHFASVVFGHANEPIYMFLDRPTRAILLLNSSLITLQLSSLPGISEASALSAINNAVGLGNRTIPVELLDSNYANWQSLYPFFASHNNTYHEVILQDGVPSNITESLSRLNYTLVMLSAQNMTPKLGGGGIGTNNTFVLTWPAIGLLSSPLLSPDITNGSIGLSYQISGSAPSALPLQQKIDYASNQSKTIASILSGGSLPVHVIVDAPTTIGPTLGSRFLLVSGIAALLAVAAVSLVIVLRYRKPFLILPILLTTFAELFIIFSIIGLVGTIDLAAMAGMIAVVGTGVDAQIIITDEVLLEGKESSIKSRFGNAFYIIWLNAALLIIAMTPLLFSVSLVSIIGFAESTILGAILGVALTRPAYAAIIKRHFEKE